MTKQNENNIGRNYIGSIDQIIFILPCFAFILKIFCSGRQTSKTVLPYKFKEYLEIEDDRVEILVLLGIFLKGLFMAS